MMCIINRLAFVLIDGDVQPFDGFEMFYLFTKCVCLFLSWLWDATSPFAPVFPGSWHLWTVIQAIVYLLAHD